MLVSSFKLFFRTNLQPQFRRRFSFQPICLVDWVDQPPSKSLTYVSVSISILFRYNNWLNDWMHDYTWLIVDLIIYFFKSSNNRSPLLISRPGLWSQLYPSWLCGLWRSCRPSTCGEGGQLKIGGVGKTWKTVDGWHPTPPGMLLKPKANTGINYQPQLVNRISEPSTEGPFFNRKNTCLPKPSFFRGLYVKFSGGG